MRISLFMPCFNDALFPGTGIATVRIFEKLGHDVVYPSDQTCCGQIHFNTGYRIEAHRLLRRFLKVFGGSEIVVAPSASCVAMVREQYLDLARDTGDSGFEGEIRDLASRTHELSEFLVGVLGVRDLGAAFPHRVAYHSTCHSMRGIDVGPAPLQLLGEVRGLQIVDPPDSEGCCGFGGTFSVKNPDTSMAMLEDKIRHIRGSGAEVLTAVDNSCLLHIAGGLHRAGHLSGVEDDGPGTTVSDRGPEAREGVGEGARPGREGEVPKLRVMHLAEILTSGWDLRA